MVEDAPDFGSFWSTVIFPGKPCQITVPEEAECSLTNLALDQDSAVDSGRVVLSLSSNKGPSIAIMPFTLGRFESSKIDLMFGSGDTLSLTTAGAQVPVHVSGYLDGAFALKIDNGADPVTE
jgi:hypothetical protein